MLTKEELQSKISETEARITAYNTFREILTDKLEKVNANQTVTFRPESGITESTTKEEKIAHLESLIASHGSGIRMEEENLVEFKRQFDRAND